MIINYEHRFVFVHIPKCAGTSVRMRLHAFDEARDVFGSRVDEHPVLGTLDYTHIPLAKLRDHFPREFFAVGAFESYALVRDPMARFRSALSQRLLMYKKVSIDQLSDTDVVREVDEVLRYLENCSLVDDHRFIHFEKQERYIEIDGDRIVRHLFAIDDVDELLRVAGEALGENLRKSQHVNVSLPYRNWVARKLARTVPQSVQRLAAELLGPRSKARLRSLTYRTSLRREFEELIGQERCDFVRSYYLRDFEIYQTTIGE